MSNEGSVYEGKTLDDAVRKGLKALGITRAEAKISVLEEGSGGFLGIGARPYRVSIAERPGGAFAEPSSREPRERSRRGQGDRGPRRNGPSGRGRAQGRRDQPAREGRPARGEGRSGRPARSEGRFGRGEGRPARADSRPPRGEGRPARADARPPRTEAAPEREENRPRPFAEEEAGTGEGERRRRRGRRGGRRRRERSGQGTQAEAPRVAAAVVEASPEREPRVEPIREPAEAEPPAAVTADASELAARGQRCTEELLGAMGFVATVTAQASEDRVDVAVSMPDQDDLLTGPKGEVRQAIQHVLNLILNRGGGMRYHLQLEINGFWERRENELRDLAAALAREALETGSEVTTEYLNSQERRIVHMSLRDDTRVKTYALGTGLIKRVAIAPADHPEPGE